MKSYFLIVFALIIMPLVALGQVGPISVNSTIVDDDNSQFSHDNSQGDGNNQISAGEKIRLVVKLKNEGTEKATSVKATISCDNPNIIFSDVSEDYKDIDPGAIVQPYSFWTSHKDGGFLFSVQESCPSTTVHFTLNITATNFGPYEQSFDLTIQGGTIGPITIAQYFIDDDNSNFADDKSQGDGNRKIDPGETIGIDLVLVNNGTIPAIGYTASLHVNYSGITVLDSVLEYSVMRVGNNTWADDYDFGHQFHFYIATNIVSDSVEFLIAIHNSANNLVGNLLLRLFVEEQGTVLLELANVYFDDDQEYYTNRRVIGNGNRIMEPRETIEVTASVRNNGTGSALEAKAILHNNSPHLAIVDSVEDFPSIRGGESASPDGWGDDRSFIVRILNTAPTGDILCPIEIIGQNTPSFFDTLAIPVDASNTAPPGSVIILTSPNDGDISRDAIITVKGYVDDPQTRVFLNSDSIYCVNGSFLGYVMNRRGNNFINIRGVNSVGTEDSVNIKVIGQPYNTYTDKVKFYLHNKASGKIDNDFLSEYAPYNTTSTVTYYPSTPDSMEWLYPLDCDIEGNQYTFSLKLSSLSTTLYTCKILVRNTIESLLATTQFTVSDKNRYEKTVTGEDPSTGIGDTLVFRLCWNKYANFWLSEYTSDLFGGSLSTSNIFVPWFMPTPVEELAHTNVRVQFKITQNYPNPFNLSTSIMYELPNYSNVEILIYNISGQLIKRLRNGKQAAGIYFIDWDGMDDAGVVLPSGIYFLQIKTDDFSDVIRMTLIK